MRDISIKAELRQELGKNKVDKLRVDEFVPGVVYGRGEETQHVKVVSREFERVYRLAGASTIIDLDLEDNPIPVLIKTVQKHPYRNEFLHVDFQKLNMKEKIRLTIPISLLGRDEIVLQPSVLMQMMDSIDIECLPGNIPESVEVDVRDMDFETPIFVKDLAIFSDEDISVLRDGEEVIATLSEPRMEEELEELDEEMEDFDPTDVEVIGEEDQEEEE